MKDIEEANTLSIAFEKNCFLKTNKRDTAIDQEIAKVKRGDLIYSNYTLNPSIIVICINYF